MSDQLRARAQADLRSLPDGKPIDGIIWEHSERVAGLTEVIAAVPELADNVIDRLALTAAALYHDAGWLLQLAAGQVRPGDLLLRRTTDRQRDLAADWLQQRLEGLLPAGTVQQAARIVRTCNERSPGMLEARILAEAENLDQVGPQAVLLMVRRQMAEGRTLSDMVVAWKRQEQYDFWPAWIKECFRFPSTRLIAEHRWQAMNRFMGDLEQVCQPMAPAEAAKTVPQTGGRLLGKGL